MCWALALHLLVLPSLMTFFNTFSREAGAAAILSTSCAVRLLGSRRTIIMINAFTMKTYVTFYHQSSSLILKPTRKHTTIPPIPIPFTPLTIQIRPHRPPKLRRPLPKHLRQVLQIISCRNPKLPHKVLCRTLKITVVLLSPVILFATEIRV